MTFVVIDDDVKLSKLTAQIAREIKTEMASTREQLGTTGTAADYLSDIARKFEAMADDEYDGTCPPNCAIHDDHT